MVLTIIPRILLVTLGVIIIAFIYFTVVFGLMEYEGGGPSVHDFGRRVGAAAMVFGAVWGALIAFFVNWDRLKRKDGSPAWVSRTLAILATLLIAIPVIYAGSEAMTSVRHYGNKGFYATLPFFYLSAYLFGVSRK